MDHEVLAALADRRRTAYIPPPSEEAVTVGDLWIAVEGDATRLVLIVREEDGIFDAHICSSSTELATDIDLVLSEPRIVAPFPIVAFGSLQLTLFPSQLSERVGRLDHDAAVAVRRAIWDDGASLKGYVTGFPLVGPADPRWQFLSDEIEPLTVLASPSRWVLLEGVFGPDY